jgi:hypothetical protein
MRPLPLMLLLAAVPLPAVAADTYGCSLTMTPDEHYWPQAIELVIDPKKRSIAIIDPAEGGDVWRYAHPEYGVSILGDPTTSYIVVVSPGPRIDQYVALDPGGTLTWVDSTGGEHRTSIWRCTSTTGRTPGRTYRD